MSSPVAVPLPDESPSPPHAPTAGSHVPARLAWPLVGAIALGMFVLRLAYAVSDAWSRHDTTAIGSLIFEEVVGSVVSLPYIWGAIAILRRWPLTRTPWLAWTLRLAVFFGLGSALHAPLLFATRAAVAPLFGLEGYTAFPTGAAWVNEALNDILPMVAMSAGMTAAEYLLESRERERRAFALQRSLLEAELRTVRLQLQPHFLFNALNTIAATMYDDPAAADALLTGLSELLRASLHSTDAQEVPLRDEIALVEQYVRLMQARFPSALVWEVTRDAGVDDVLVPSMLLQPLVENAVRHGALATIGRGRVQLTARIVADATLELRVHDDGPGVRDSDEPLHGGTGLSATRQRLLLLHGDAASLEAGTAPEGGFSVTIRLPARRASLPVTKARRAPEGAARPLGR